MIYKALNNDAPDYMKDIFKYVHQVSAQTLRSSAQNKLYLQKAHPKSIKYFGPRLWNSLCRELRNAKSVKQFKYLYSKHVLHTCSIP